MEINKTQRGFDFIEFVDRYGEKCSIQKSSLATEDAIWFGIDNVDPQVMGAKGWEKYPIPSDVLLNARMHLTQQMVIDLLPTLIKFAETGDLS